MEVFISLFIYVILIRWIFRVGRIVTVLEQMATNLENIKQQNNTLIQQQDALIKLTTNLKSIKQQTSVLIKQQNELIEQQDEIAELLEAEQEN
jgi:hypothetical protein